MRIGIQHKLAITFVVIAMIVASALFFGVQHSFRQGFLHYLNELSEQQLDATAQLIQADYSTSRRWERLSHNARFWHQAIRQSSGLDNEIGMDRPPRRPPRDDFSRDDRGREHQRNSQSPGSSSRGEFNQRDSRQDRDTYKRDKKEKRDRNGSPKEKGGPRPRIPLVLLGPDKSIIYGREMENTENLRLRPIMDRNQELLGYVGLMPLKRVSNDADKIFIREQIQVFAGLTLVAVLISLLLAWPIARKFTAPIKNIGKGMNALTHRKYDTRVDIHSKDELGDLAENFNQMARTLGEYDNSQRQWLADIAHELRTPLAVLRGEIEAMQDGIRPLDQKHIASLGHEAQHLAHLVDDLHQLALSDLGTLRYQFDPLRLDELVDQQLTMSQASLFQAGLDYELKVEGDTKNIKGDEHRLLQLFNNLLQNSLRYTDSPGRILVTVRYGRHKVRCTWEDTSPGVAPENINKLFDRLFREDQSRNRSSGGSGLGLAICKKIVEAHQGKIYAEASSLGGLKTVIEFPDIS